ncbi:MAG: nuclear transport factor 2 family protein [Pelomonas sp.]|nr:nuclear transport factor 2 family protein [Roseateles sp.]
MHDAIAHLELQQLVARFANAFDLKDWDGLGACLADSLHTDYSELRGTPPETLTRERFVELRRAALGPLATQHLAGNIEIEARGARADLKVAMAIFRRGAAGEQFNTHCLYFFGAVRAGGGWRIDSIRQKVLMSVGDARIHAGVAKPA